MRHHGVLRNARHRYLSMSVAAFAATTLSLAILADPVTATELTVARPDSGTYRWFTFNIPGSVVTRSNVVYGNVGEDVPVGADWDGDGTQDPAVWRAAEAWHVFGSSSGDVTSVRWGEPGDMVAPADYDGDGRLDYAVWRPADSVWYILESSRGYAIRTQSWGEARYGDVPVPADYDGDGKDDIAVWRPSDGWWIANSTGGWTRTGAWGEPGDTPVPGDYDGDGKADLAIWRPSDVGDVSWWVLSSASGSRIPYAERWGELGDIAVPGDYDGDGITDRAVWRPSEGNWYILASSSGAHLTYNWGQPGDIPMPPKLSKKRGAPAGGKYVLPLPLAQFRATAGNLAQHHYGSNFWAIDLIVPEGNNVYSVSSGTVVKAELDTGSKTGCGNFVRVFGNDGMHYIYCHGKDAPAVHVNQAVSPGTFLMRSGNTGDSGTPHLHFEIKAGPRSASWDSMTPYCAQPFLRAILNGAPASPFIRQATPTTNCRSL